MITLIQGVPGSGKSAMMTADMLDFLEFGGTIACNFDLVPGWSDKLAAADLKCKLGLRSKEQRSYDLWSRAYKIGSPDTIFELSKVLTKKNKSGKMIEGQGRLYIDEAQLLFNSRQWQKNYGYIEFLTQHRKLGWDVYIVAHSDSMIDSQIRELFEIEARFRNLKKVKMFGLFPISMGALLFLAIFRYAGKSAGTGTIAYRRLYHLKKQYADCYDSMEVFAFGDSKRSISHHGNSPNDKYQNYELLSGMENKGLSVRSDLPIPYSCAGWGSIRSMI